MASMKEVIAGMAVFFGGLFLFCLYCSFEWEKMELELHNQFVEKVERLAKSWKIIVMFNHMEERSYPLIDGYCLDTSGQEYQNKFCPHKCFYTDDKSALHFAHAVVFSARNLETNKTVPTGLPHIRYENQSWVLFSPQSPLYPIRDFQGNIVDNDLYMPAFEGLFNLTMNYRHDADIRIPFGRVLSKIERHSKSYGKKVNVPELLRKKQKFVAWISSDCFMERSGRTLLVAQLQQYLQVDIYGECGPYRCSTEMTDFCHDHKSCYEQIGSTYKFYLALETALCEDYVSEKFFYALEYGMVPVVYGKANYSDIAVPGSFINVMDFASVKELAGYLKYLDETPEEYIKFFDWRQHSFVTRTFYMHMAWCSFCSKLWEMDGTRTVSVALDLMSLNGTKTYWKSRVNSFSEEINNSSSLDLDLRKMAIETVDDSTSGSSGIGTVRSHARIVPWKSLVGWWPDVAIPLGVCEKPPNFVTNTLLKLEVPVRKTPVRRYIDFMEEL